MKIQVLRLTKISPEALTEDRFAMSRSLNYGAVGSTERKFKAGRLVVEGNLVFERVAA